MALFTDGSISTIEDMLAYESAILDVSKTEGIDLTKKLGLAADEVGVEIESFFGRQFVTASLGQVVVSDAIHTWHTLRAICLTYRDAYNHQLHDRHLKKYQDYERLSQWARDALFDAGVGITFEPIPRAGRPVFTLVNVPLSGATYYVRTSWWGTNGEEGAPSETAVFIAPDGIGPAVTPAAAPSLAIGWNLYAGTEAGELTLQNNTPMPLGQTWQLPAGGLEVGRPPTMGQQPDTYIARTRTLNRG